MTNEMTDLLTIKKEIDEILSVQKEILEIVSKGKPTAEEINLIERISQKFFDGKVEPRWENLIMVLLRTYHLDDKVIEILFLYCFNMNALVPSYIRSLAEKFYREKIKTYDEFIQYDYKHHNRYTKLGRVLDTTIGSNP